MTDEQEFPSESEAFSDEARERTDKAKRAKKGTHVTQPAKEVTEKRRELVETWWIEGRNLADIRERLHKETGELWSRQTITNDITRMREQWEREGSKRSREQVRLELERMCRVVIDKALRLQKVVTRRELDAEGKMKVTSVLLPAPDLSAVNSAIERMAALHGLNIRTLDGQLDLSKGLAEFFGEVAGDALDEAASE